MRVVRLSKRKYQVLDGFGAALTGGRWNSPSRRLVYTASSSALAVLEYLVHLEELPQDLILSFVDIPDSLEIEEVEWVPADPHASQQMGDEWLASLSSPVLRVPSVIAPDSFNYLLNPSHSRFGEISVSKTSLFAFDGRLLSSLPNA